MAQSSNESSIRKLPSHVKKMGGSSVPFAKKLGWQTGQYYGDALRKYCQENKVHDNIYLVQRIKPLPHSKLPAANTVAQPTIQTTVSTEQLNYADPLIAEVEKDYFESNLREIVSTEHFEQDIDATAPMDIEPEEQATAPSDIDSIVKATKSMTLASAAIAEQMAELNAEPIGELPSDAPLTPKTRVSISVQVGDGLIEFPEVDAEPTVPVEDDTERMIVAPAKRKWRLNKRIQVGNGLIVQAHLQAYPNFPEHIYVPVPIVYFYRHQEPAEEMKPIEGPLYFRHLSNYAQLRNQQMQSGNGQLVCNAQDPNNVQQQGDNAQGEKRPIDQLIE